MMTRQEHLDWAKQRALEYVEAGELTKAFGSIASDLNKHPETEKHAGIELGMILLVAGQLGTPEKMREFIEGFR